MIELVKGNLLRHNAEALVNTVNCVGVMGKGIALQFKKEFPENFRQYAQACEAGRVKTGEMFATRNPDMFGPKWIVNFPTKQDWRHPSKMIWIESGLQALARFIVENKVTSIAIPALGCSNGGLAWEDVRPRIEVALGTLPDVLVYVYPPQGNS